MDTNDSRPKGSYVHVLDFGARFFPAVEEITRPEDTEADLPAKDSDSATVRVAEEIRHQLDSCRR